MSTLYLIRHGEPEFPGGLRLCLGRTDLPLSILGRLQAALAAAGLRGRVSAVYSSPLKRAAETAGVFEMPVETLPGLAEQDAGEWDGLSFEEIRAGWPELYARRGEQPYLPMPGAEPEEAVVKRFADAVEYVRRSGADAALVSHAGAIRLYMKALGLRAEKLPYGAYAVLDGRMQAVCVRPHPELDDGVCLALLRAARLPEKVIRHCAAVADAAGELALQAGMDAAPIRSAAYLHDIARLQPEHPQTGSAWLEALGYPEAAELIRRHHDHDGAELDAAGIVCLADKLVLGDRRCTIKERFDASAAKCRTPEQREIHALRRESAERLARLAEKRGIRYEKTS